MEKGSLCYLFFMDNFPQFWQMLQRFSNITLLVICGFLIVGIIVTRRIDTAIEWNVDRQNQQRLLVQDFKITCTQAPTKLIQADTASWARIQYTLPSFSSYNLDKRQGLWYLDTIPTNIAATQKYLGKIAAASWKCTVTHSKPETLKVPDYVLEIITTSAETLWYKTYVVDTAYLLQDRTGQLYYGNADSLFWQLYFGRHRFTPAQ